MKNFYELKKDYIVSLLKKYSNAERFFDKLASVIYIQLLKRFPLNPSSGEY